MKQVEEIMREIKNLNFYTPEEWEEYISHFSNSEYLKKALSAHTINEQKGELFRRIKEKRGVIPVKADYEISPKIVNRDYLSSPNVRKKISLGVVSGCFDLLHISHIKTMAYSKGFLRQFPNTKLCVITLSDENIKAKKGNSRPILNMNERLKLLCNIKCIDYVIPLKEPNCLCLLEKLKPEFFFKGESDKSQEIVKKEMELVKSYGGSVVIIPDNSSCITTTRLIDAILYDI